MEVSASEGGLCTTHDDTLGLDVGCVVLAVETSPRRT